MKLKIHTIFLKNGHITETMMLIYTSRVVSLILFNLQKDTSIKAKTGKN